MFSVEREAILTANPSLKPWRECWRQGKSHNRGFATKNMITVFPASCTLPGRGYSWPGSVSDCTVRGVYLHEIGHIVHASFIDERRILQNLWELAGPPVTGYEPNPMERFAETFRLFAGNPALLLAGRPRRFEYMCKIGLQPMANMPRNWERGLLGNPPQRFLEQCERWIARNKS